MPRKPQSQPRKEVLRELRVHKLRNELIIFEGWTLVTHVFCPGCGSDFKLGDCLVQDMQDVICPIGECRFNLADFRRLDDPEYPCEIEELRQFFGFKKKP